MDPQLLAVLGITGLAALYVARAAVRLFTAPGKGCSSGCGKCSTPAMESPSWPTGFRCNKSPVHKLFA